MYITYLNKTGIIAVLINLRSRGLVSWIRWLIQIQVLKGQASRDVLRHAPPDRLWNAFLCEAIPLKKTNLFLKSQNTKNIKELQRPFSFYSYRPEV